MSILSRVMERFESQIEKACSIIAKRARSVQTFHAEGIPYLTRHYFTKRSHEGRRGFGLYLHYFHMGDPDPSFHNHPFDYSCSLILTNGYVEERWNEKKQQVDINVLKPGDINVIRADDFHRVDLRDPTRGAWTIFFSGKRIKDWGFWWPGVHEYTPHEEYVRSRDHAQQFRA